MSTFTMIALPDIQEVRHVWGQFHAATLQPHLEIMFCYQPNHMVRTRLADPTPLNWQVVT